jgi:hypothetical protein
MVTCSLSWSECDRGELGWLSCCCRGFEIKSRFAGESRRSRQFQNKTTARHNQQHLEPLILMASRIKLHIATEVFASLKIPRSVRCITSKRWGRLTCLGGYLNEVNVWV